MWFTAHIEPEHMPKISDLSFIVKENKICLTCSSWSSWHICTVCLNSFQKHNLNVINFILTNLFIYIQPHELTLKQMLAFDSRAINTSLSRQELIKKDNNIASILNKLNVLLRETVDG